MININGKNYYSLSEMLEEFKRLLKDNPDLIKLLTLRLDIRKEKEEKNNIKEFKILCKILEANEK